jgi:folate-binding protein YgfZ
MALTPLQDALRGQAHTGLPVRGVEYRGAESASSFGNPDGEFAALQNGCGIYDLGFRAVLLLKGEDRTRWMNGMVTNNVRDLAAGHGVYAFLLNPQGRILADLHIYNMGEALEVVTDRLQVEKIAATFDHFIIMDDVEVTNISEGWTTLGLAGPEAWKALNAAGIEVPVLEALEFVRPRCNCDCGCVSCTVVRGEDVPNESYEIWLAPKDVLKTWQALIAAGATPVGSEALEMQRIAAGVPLYGVDIRERDLPQETEQMHALNFSKGCYVGQEIVERIRSRGNVHRTFTGFLIDGAASVRAGEKIQAGDKEVGEITSVAVLPVQGGERTAALGYIRREVAMPGREVKIGSSKAVVAQLPLVDLALPPDDVLLHKV